MRTGLRLDQAPPLHLPLRFFLTGPLFGVAAGALLVFQGAGPLLSPWSFPALALVHLITLGFLTMVMAGALYQITPVLVGVPVPGAGLARLVHLGLTGGLAALAGGLLTGEALLHWLALAGLLPAFLIFLGQMALAFRRAPSFNPTVVSMAIALAALATAVLLGLLFVGETGGLWHLPARRALAATHVYLALGGWVGTLITGVGYAVIPMFYLAGTFPARMTRLVIVFQVLLLLGGPLVAFLADGVRWLLLPIALAALATGLFTRVFVTALAGRKRRISDTTLRYWKTGILAVPLSLAALVLFVLSLDPRWLMAFGVLFLLGFALSIMTGMLYKIVAFLVWLHRFSHQAGKLEVPLLRDIIPNPPPAWQWWSHLLMLGLLLLAVLTGHDGAARASGLALMVSSGALFGILLRAARFDPPLAPARSAADPHPHPKAASREAATRPSTP